MKPQEEIRKMIDDVEIVDTHEHLYPPGTMDPITDFPNLLRQSYVIYDFISAGMIPDD